MTTEVAAVGSRSTFCQVQRNAVSGPPPLRGEREPLVGRQAPDGGARQYHEVDGLLPCAELSAISHRSTLAGAHFATIIIFRTSGPFPCNRYATWNPQRVTCDAVTPTLWSPEAWN